MGLGVIQEGCLTERSGYLQIRSIVIKLFSLTQNKRLKKITNLQKLQKCWI